MLYVCSPGSIKIVALCWLNVEYPVITTVTKSLFSHTQDEKWPLKQFTKYVPFVQP